MARRKRPIYQPYRPLLNTSMDQNSERKEFDTKRFESLEEFLSLASECPYESGIGTWFNHETAQQSTQYARSGNESIVNDAQALIDQIDNDFEGKAIEKWQPSVSGAYPIVPEFLAGHPQCMRHICESDEVAPVSIYVCTTSSASIHADQYMRRGAAVLALVLKLQQVRPVNLYITFECDGGYKSNTAITVIPVESRPLCIAQAAYLLSSTGFSRHLTYGYAERYQGSNLHWIPDHKYGQPNEEYHRNIRRYLDLSPIDLHLEPIGAHDPMLTDPVAWINEQITRFNSQSTTN